MLEKSKSPQFGLNLQSKISRKLSLCQKLQSFFEETKKIPELKSFEYLSTSLMISAKIFENEEDVKTFVKHSRYSNRSSEFLKSVELEILEKKEWNLDHSSLFDFGMHYMSNHLFRSKDIVIIPGIFKKSRLDRFASIFDFFQHKVGIEANLFERLAFSIFKGKLKKIILKPMRFIGDLEKDHLKKLREGIMKHFAIILKSIIKQFIFKSNLKIVFVIFVIIHLKEWLFGADFIMFYQIKEYLSSLIIQ